MNILPYDSTRDLDLYIEGELASIKNSIPSMKLENYIVEGIKESYKRMVNSEALSGFTALYEEPVGFIVVSKESQMDQPYGLVRNLYVGKKGRGRLVWKALSSHAEEYFRNMGIHKVAMEIYEPNKSAYELALHEGFSVAHYHMEKTI